MSNNPFRTQKDEGYVSEGANEESTHTAGASKEMDVGVHIPVTEGPTDLPEVLQDLHVSNASQSTARPPYVRAPSSHVPESIAPKPNLTAQEAHAEAIRRLGKAEHTVKTLKRRGSNESLSSLLSYSIRRPSLSAVATPSTPKSGYGLDALAHVLEDAAQEGNLPLVQAIFALGANPNFRSVNRIKNRRHHALDKAVAGGHVDVIDFLMRQGATFDLGRNGKDEFEPIDYKLLDTAYAGFMDVVKYLIVNQGANPNVQMWPREYKELCRTIYRRVEPARAIQRTVLDALAKWGDQDSPSPLPLLKSILTTPGFNPSSPAHSIYLDQPYAGDGTRMHQTTHSYSALSLFVRSGWPDAVEHILSLPSSPGPEAYEIPDEVDSEEGQIPSTITQRTIWPINALTYETYTSNPAAALRILRLLLASGFSPETAQQTPDDSAPRSPMARAMRADCEGAVRAMVQARPGLGGREVGFRLLVNGEEREYVATPLGAAKMMGAGRCVEVLRGWENRVDE